MIDHSLYDFRKYVKNIISAISDRCLKLVSFLSLLILPLTGAYSQDEPVFDHIPLNDGLAVVSAICRDSRNFMWFGTMEGIYRYDGRKTKKFECNEKDSLSISGSNVRVIYEDKGRNLWVGTENGLSRFNYNKEKFLRICNDSSHKDLLLDNFIINISEDSNGGLLVVTRHGLNRFNPETKSFSHYVFPSDDGNGQITASCVAGKDTICLFGNGRVYLFLSDKSVFIGLQPVIKTKAVLAMLKDDKNNFWLGTHNDGVYKINKKGNVVHYYPSDGKNSGLQSIKITGINQDSKGNMWLSAVDGLYRYDGSDDKFIKLKNAYSNPLDLTSSYTKAFYQDWQNIIWVGTASGVNKFNPGKVKFKHFKTNILSGNSETINNSSSDNFIWSFYRDHSDNLWVGSTINPLSYLPFNKLGKENFKKAVFYSGEKNNLLPFHSVLDICPDSRDNLWLGTDNGLYYYNTRTHTIKGFRHQEGIKNSLCDNMVVKIVNCGDTTLWLGTVNGLSRFVPSKARFTNFYHNSGDKTSLVSNYVYYAYIDNDNNLWISAADGLSCLDLKDPLSFSGDHPVFRNLRSDPDNPESSFNIVFSFLRSHDDYLWIGTNNGLFQLDTTMKIVKHFSVKEGIPHKSIIQMQEDSHGRLWLSTENGISCFDPGKNIFRNFDVNDGLQSNEFNILASYKDNFNNLYFGGINGFNIISPDSVKFETRSSSVVITGMLLNNKPVEPGSETDGFKIDRVISEVDGIVLNYDQNFFSFEFSALDYTSPEKIKYEYKLDGFDQQWVSCGNTPFANYTNVKPGNYVFKVRATNSDGIWSRNLAELKVRIKPPFWKTIWFYAFATVSFTLIIFFILRFRERSLKRKTEILENEVQKRAREIIKINDDLRRSNSFIESVINNSPYGIAVINLRGRIIMANRETSIITGYSNSDLLLMSLDDLTTDRWKENNKEIFNSQKSERSIFQRSEYKRKDNTVIKVSVFSSYIKDYDPPAFVIIINDITDMVANEIELQNHRNNLESLVNERTADLIIEKERAEKADRLKAAFLSNISHEIRTPMNSIIGFSNLLKSQPLETEYINEYLDYITSGANSLLSIVTDIVEISRISTNDITFSSRKVEIIKFLNDIIPDYKIKANQKGLDFYFENSSGVNDLWILTDEGKLTAILNHLLDNALKFTSKGYILLKISFTAEEVKVVVEDTGIGIPSEMKNDIFEPFKQADITFSRAYGGAGLGLAISKAYVEKMGGKIWLESEPGSGSKFFFTFPLVKFEKPGDEQNPEVKNQKPNILIVEDEDMNFFYLSEILKKRANEIIHVRDGYSAVEQCRNNKLIDIVLMDIKLPGMNGIEATAEIKKIRPDLPVVAQTAYSLIGDREKAILAGCNDYITKPINREKLYSIIDKYFNGHSDRLNS